jgi:hypothetical protein
MQGCTWVVVQHYNDGAMKDSLYFWVDDYETPDIMVSWSRSGPKYSAYSTQLVMQPGLNDCQFVDIFVNGATKLPSEFAKALEVAAIDANEAVIPDDTYPKCSVVLTYGRKGTPPDFSITAATADGAFKEFPNGRRRPAWLLLLPLAAVPDVALGAALGILLPVALTGGANTPGPGTQ